MNQDEQFIGFLKYSGISVEDGLLDLRKSAEALLGFDEILRYFLLKEDPHLSKIEFEIPVRIRKGSWEALIPAFIIGSLGIALTTYLKEMAKKAATDGMFETGIAKDIKKIFQGALISIQWIIKIAKHLGILAEQKFENLKIENEGHELFVLIPNENNEILKVPKKYYDLYVSCPVNLFNKNANLIEKDRVLEIGVFEEGKEKKEIVTSKEKSIFYNDDDNSDIVLPELLHGQFVDLEGAITRATENKNTIGFRYKDHTLVCKPQSGTIAQFKDSIISNKHDQLFPIVHLIGQVDRTDKNGDFKEKKPEIFFSDIIPLSKDNISQSSLNFDNIK